MVERPRDGARTRADIRTAAADLFYEHGYEATSLRTVADRVGIKVGSLYNHMGGKDELLVDIMRSVFERLQPLVESASDDAGDDPIRKLRAVVGEHLRFHAQHAKETFIGNSELRSLSTEARADILRQRKVYETFVRSHIESAAAAEGIELLDGRLQTYAVLALGMHIASWFHEGSGLSLEHIITVYTEISLRQIGLAAVTSPA